MTGPRPVEDALAGPAASLGIRRIARAEELRAQPERGGEASREVGTDRPTGGDGSKYRALAEVASGASASAEVVVALGKTPDVVVAEDPLTVAVSHPDLVVDRSGSVVGHLEEPVRAEPGLLDVARPNAREGVVQRGKGEQRIREARRLDELEVIAGVEPPSRDVLRAAGANEAARELTLPVRRGPVDEGAPVIQMGRAASEHARIHDRSVALAGEEAQRVPHQR